MSKNTSGLIPFKAGEDDPRRGRRGNPSPLNDPEIVDLFAKGVTDGLTNDQLADQFTVTPRTVRNWKNDPRVKNAAYKFINDRIVRITAKTDAKLDALLRGDRFTDLPIEEQVGLLLKVRKEYLGGILRLQAEGGKPDADTVNQAMNELEDHPEFATELRELLERQPETE